MAKILICIITLTICCTILIYSSCEALWEYYFHKVGQHPALSISSIVCALTSYSMLVPMAYKTMEQVAMAQAYKSK